MQLAKNGDRVKVHYTGKFEASGEVFDSSEGGDPLEFVVGGGQLIEGFDEAIVGMGIGQSKTVTLPPEKAYGERSEERVVQAPRSELPDDAEVNVGDVLEVTIGGQTFPAPVTSMDAETLTLDLNPPLAGHTLVFDLTLVAIAE